MHVLKKVLVATGRIIWSLYCNWKITGSRSMMGLSYDVGITVSFTDPFARISQKHGFIIYLITLAVNSNMSVCLHVSKHKGT